jgi:8-oxo-dGTP pyrophosphatase MutT (NUDIX family)
MAGGYDGARRGRSLRTRGLLAVIAPLVAAQSNPGEWMNDTSSAGLRLAATLLLVRDNPFEVLMVRRNSRATFASALVFPGGGIESDDRSPAWATLVHDFDDFDEDERALRIGAIRETWEETSILAAAAGGVRIDADQAAASSFRELVEASGARLVLGTLARFGHWITPLAEARRFDTHFFLAPAPAGQLAVSDGAETVGVEWVAPAHAVALAASGELPIIFPTLMNLARLAESGDLDGAMTAARVRQPFTVQPVIEIGQDGSRLITIPREAGYSATTFTVPPSA